MQYFLLLILALALAAMQILVGGATLAYALPAYCLLAIGGLGALAYPGRNECARTRLACVLSALALGGYVALRSWLSPVEYLARADFYMILGVVVVYLLTAVHLSGSRQRLAIVWMIFFVVLLHVVVGAVQFKRQDDWMLLPWIYRPTYWFRASGFYLSPNHLAGLLEMLAPMLLSVCVWARGPFAMRAFAAYGFIACLGGITLTGSRTAYLSVFLGTLLFVGISLAFVYNMRRREFWSVALVAGSVFAVVMSAALFFMIRSEALSERLGDFSGSGNARIMHSAAAFQQFKLNKDFGTGSGTYLIFGRQFRAHTPAYDPAHVHNDYLELLAEYGLAGAALMAAFLLIHFATGTFGLRKVILRKLRHGTRTKSNEMALLTGALCGTAALLIHSITDYNLHVPANALFIAFLFGIIANPTAETVASTALASNRWLRFIGPTVALLLLVKAWPHVPGEYLAERTRIAARKGEHAEVIAFADRALQREPAMAELYNHRGEAQLRLALQATDAAEREALLRQAHASFEEGLKIFPRDSRLWAALGRAQDQLRAFGPAEQSFRQAFALEPNSADIYAAYGLHWQLQNEPAKASECFERARILRGIATPQGPKRQAAAVPSTPVPLSVPEPVAIPNFRNEPTPSSTPARPKPVKKPPFFTQ